MSEEKKIILEMLKEGKISVSEAEELLSKVDSNQETSIVKQSDNKKFLKVFVVEGTKTKVNIRIPLTLASVGLKLIPKDKLHYANNSLDVQNVLDMIASGAEGELINIDTVDDGEEVKVQIAIV